MLTQQFVVQEIILGSVAGERFEQETDDEHAAVNAVSPPGELGPGRIERDHDPDAEPEKRGDDQDLTKQEKAIKTLLALGDHFSSARLRREYAMAPFLQLVLNLSPLSCLA